jgi:hypothetical protein
MKPNHEARTSAQSCRQAAWTATHICFLTDSSTDTILWYSNALTRLIRGFTDQLIRNSQAGIALYRPESPIFIEHQRKIDVRPPNAKSTCKAGITVYHQTYKTFNKAHSATV